MNPTTLPASDPSSMTKHVDGDRRRLGLNSGERSGNEDAGRDLCCTCLAASCVCAFQRVHKVESSARIISLRDDTQAQRHIEPSSSSWVLDMRHRTATTELFNLAEAEADTVIAGSFKYPSLQTPSFSIHIHRKLIGIISKATQTTLWNTLSTSATEELSGPLRTVKQPNLIMDPVSGHCFYCIRHNGLQQTGEKKESLPDGRGPSYAEYGYLNGFPVFFFHGFPSSRLETYPVDKPAYRQ
ncbi:hypothetical protein AJ80_07717 [Polytolypa hystricis UAMH7299]|uniref:Uncharacterized protein n=1 Tax=Polytolypa hystricis (strain UAMH7299) TaxID=1447883 RepID=A0A2B7XJZ9_POLH7|nr:hypothetical protein AJ80_07717 [Polytolypa hystricis UAMH7299]